MRSSSGTNTSVRRVRTTSTPGSFSAASRAAARRRAPAPLRSTPRPCAPGSCPPCPGSITIRETPRPSCRDSENRPRDSTDGGAGATSGAPVGLGASGCAAAARRRRRGVAVSLAVGRSSVAPVPRSPRAAPASRRRPASTSTRSTDRRRRRVGSGSIAGPAARTRARPCPAASRARRAEHGRHAATAAAVQIDHEPVRVVEREDAVARRSLEVEHDARRAVRMAAECAPAVTSVVLERQRRVDRRRDARVVCRSKNTRSGSSIRSLVDTSTSRSSSMAMRTTSGSTVAADGLELRRCAARGRRAASSAVRRPRSATRPAAGAGAGGRRWRRRGRSRRARRRRRRRRRAAALALEPRDRRPGLSHERARRILGLQPPQQPERRRRDRPPRDSARSVAAESIAACHSALSL